MDLNIPGFLTQLEIPPPLGRADLACALFFAETWVFKGLK
jgi:hypothetical protein